MVCPLLLAIGFGILLVSEFTGVAALRIVAAGVLLAGAIGGGVRAGLAADAPALFVKLVQRFTLKIARVLAVVLMLPVALTLVLAMTGAALRDNGTQSSMSLTLMGAVIALVLLALLAAALAIVMRATAEKAA